MELVPLQKNERTPNGSSQLITICSGKGGVGKTFIASSIGITLAKLGHKVVVVDLDFAGANLHTWLGVAPQFLNLRHYLDGTKSIQEVVSSTQIPHLSFIQGFWDQWHTVDISPASLTRLVSDLRSLRADYVIVDVGAGSSNAQLYMLKQADDKIVVTTPEPTSVEKTYRLFENYMSYVLEEKSNPEAYAQMLVRLRDHRHHASSEPFSFHHYIHNTEGIQAIGVDALRANPFRIIVNASRSHSDHDLGYSMKSVCTKYFDLTTEYLGAISFENAVWQSIRVREPVLISQPFTSLTGEFLSISKQLVHPNLLQAVV